MYQRKRALLGLPRWSRLSKRHLYMFEHKIKFVITVRSSYLNMHHWQQTLWTAPLLWAQYIHMGA